MPRSAGLFDGMGGHHSARAHTVEWLTPPWILDALGGWQSFDLDPCTPATQPWPTARARYTKADNGLAQPWSGRVYLNPPYTASVIGRWLARLADHGVGTALIFARTETENFCRFVWDRAHAVLFLQGRVTFHLPDGRLAGGTSGAPSVLVAYGRNDADVLAGAELRGRFVPLLLDRGVAVLALQPLASEADGAPEPDQREADAAATRTWRREIAAWLARRSEPVRLDELYRAFAAHPKAAGNRNVQAKIRQTLQEGPFRRVDRGLWALSI